MSRAKRRCTGLSYCQKLTSVVRIVADVLSLVLMLLTPLLSQDGNRQGTLYSKAAELGGRASGEWEVSRSMLG